VPTGLFIVAADRPDIHAQALRGVEAFGITGDVEIVLDRRRGERRQPGRLFDAASIRRNDRRRIVIEPELQAKGWAFVSADARDAAAPHVPMNIDLGMSGADDSPP
jgi:hypothetical protein